MRPGKIHQQNKERVEKNIVNYFEGIKYFESRTEEIKNINIIDETIKQKEELLRKQDPLIKEDITNLCQMTEKLANLRCGVIQTIVPNDGSNPKQQIHTRISNSTYKNSSHIDIPSNTPESYMTILAGTARGAYILMEHGGKKDTKIISDLLKSSLNEIADYQKSYFQNLKDADQKNDEKLKLKTIQEGQKKFNETIKDFNTKLVKSLKEMELKVDGGKPLKDKEIVKSLNTARHMGQLEDDHYHEVSISKPVGGNNIIQANVLIPATLNSETLKKQFRDSGIMQTTQWYKDLPPIEQKMMHTYGPIMAQDNKMTSSQLNQHNNLCLQSNSFTQMSFIKPKDEPLKKIGNEINRIAPIAQYQDKSEDTKKENIELSKKRMEALIDYVKPPDIKAEKLESSYYLLTSSNFLNKGKEGRIGERIPQIAKGLNKAKGTMKVKKFPLSYGFSLKHFLNFKKDERLQEITEEVNKPKEKNEIILMGCMSNKDRGGVAGFNVLVDAAKNAINKPNDGYIYDIAKAVAETGAAERVTGGPGGTRGVYGLKITNVLKGMSKTLSQSHASFKNKIAKNNKISITKEKSSVSQILNNFFTKLKSNNLKSAASKASSFKKNQRKSETVRE